MKLDSASGKLRLSEDDARIAVAYLGDTETSQLLAGQIASKEGARNVKRTGIGNFVALGSYSEEDPDKLIRESAPHLFEYELGYDHRAPLLGAYVLCAEGQEPTRVEMLEGIRPERIESLAANARDTLIFAAHDTV
jgi:hypothetical protein